MAAAILLIAPALASADTSSTLTVIGTSDMSDSGLFPNVIQTGFQKAYPQYTFKYIGTGTGNAIAQAESGAAGASVLVVHAESLENEFVAGGYSYEQYGRALWINDFVLAGSNADPAGVVGNASNNIALAFADVAAAGINGGATPKATFVSRGGTPGTTVAEHAIWQLVSSSGLSPLGSAAVHGQCRERRRRDTDRRRSRRDRLGAALPQRRCVADGHSAAGVVRRNGAESGAERSGGQRLQRLPERCQFLLRVHRQRHVRLPRIRD